MNKDFQGHTIRFVFFVLIQILILNNINLSGYINPYPYLLFILILPPRTNPILLISLGFMLGISIDIFTNSGGVHAAATVLIAYIRPKLIRFVTSRPLEEIGKINLYTFGIGNFILYAGMAIFIHHLLLFNLDIFRFNEFLSVIGKTILSGIFSLVLIVFHQLITAKRRNEL